MASYQQIEKLREKLENEPTYFSSNILGNTIWEKQQQVMESVRDYQYTVVRSGHGVGKTFIAAEIVLWYLFSFYPSKVITTAPTWNQVKMVLWEQISKLYRVAKIPLGGTLIQTQLKLNDEHFAAGFSTDEPDRFVGHHSPHILVVFDEGPGVNAKIWEAAQGLLTSKNSRFLAIGNPTTPYGPFYEAFKNSLYNKIAISCYECPNVVQDKIIFPGLVTKEWIEQRKQQWGETSPIFKSRVLGEFPVEGEDTLIPLTWVERALGKEIADYRGKDTVLGIDVARYGSDSTVFTIMQGKQALHIEGYVGKATTKTVGKAILLQQQFNCSKILVDDSGVGGGVTDMLQEKYFETDIEVIAVNFGSKANDQDRFDNLKAEIYWNLREDFDHNLIGLPQNDKLLEQLPSLLYEITSKGKLHIVSKDKMKELGVDSPDYADSLAIAHYGSYGTVNNIIDFYKEKYEEKENTPAGIINSLDRSSLAESLQQIS